MSRLSVYWPDDANLPLAANDHPATVSFSLNRKLKLSAGEPLDVVSRAKALYQNRRCHDCGYPVVEPIELADSAVNRNGMSIPGTATLIGFRCRGCKCEWGVE